ncbi:response regulator transcription factor [Burkholderia pyrrocinia]|uniref:Response regulator transcription factor n=1 Tax=Burkholderia pyrrocinia TaxID=60550 RepID=A0ABZ3BN20_BURPY
MSEKRRIVVIDDHPAILFAVHNLLSRLPDVEIVGQASTGLDGLLQVLKLEPDLVVLDLDLPLLDGMSVLRRIRTAGNHIRVLVLSAQNEALFADKARQMGAHGFVSKGRDLEAVMHATHAVLNGYTFFPTSASGGGAKPSGNLHDLSVRELEVLRRLARGQSNMQIAKALCLSHKTISTYKARLLAKLSLSSVVELAEFARLNDLTG